MDRGEIGHELLREAWGKCERVLFERKICEPWSLDNFYEAMKSYRDGGGARNYTSEYTYRYILMEVLIKSVNSIVYGEDDEGGRRQVQFFSVTKDLNKKLTDKRQRTSYVNEVVKYIEMVKRLTAKERYGLEMCDNFSNCVMFQYSEHFGDYVENSGKADWRVWMMLDEQSLAMSATSSVCLGQEHIGSMTLEETSTMTMNMGKRDRREASESKTDPGAYDNKYICKQSTK